MADPFFRGGGPVTGRRAWGVVLGIAGLAATLAVVFFATPLGLRWSLRMAAAVLPGTLTVQSVQGRLAGSLDMEGIVYRDADMEITAESLVLAWRPASLPRGLLHLENLSVRGLVIRFMPAAVAETDGATDGLPPFTLPLAVVLEKSAIDSLRLLFPEDPVPLLLDQILLEQVKARGDRLRVGGIAAVIAENRINLHGEMRTSGEYPGRWAVDFSTVIPEVFPLTGSAHLEGPLSQLDVRADLSAPFPATLRGEVRDLLGDIRWNAEFLSERAVLAEANGDWPEIVLADFRAAGNGTLADYKFRVETAASYAELMDLRLRAEIAGDGDGLALSGVRLALRDDILAGEGRIAWREGFAWQGTLAGERFALAALDAALPAVVLAGLSLKGQGEADEYFLQVETDLAYDRLSDIRAAVLVKGNAEGLRVTDLRLRHGQAQVTGEGQLTWVKGLAWQGQASGTGIDPSAWHRQWPGRLDFSMTASGSLTDDALQGKLHLSSLQGSLRDYHVQGEARLALADDILRIERASLRSGDSSLEVSGSYGDRVALDAELNSSDLASLWPKMAGRLQARAGLHGLRTAPRFMLDLTGSEFSLADTALAEVTARMEGEFAKEGALALELRASQMRVAGFDLDSLAVDLHGPVQQHRLQAELRAGSDALRLRIDGGLAEEAWRGSVAMAELEERHVGVWRLVDAAPLVLSAQTSSLGELCLAEAAGGRICAQGDFTAGGAWQAEALFDNVSLAQVPADMLNDVRLEGRMSGRLEAEGENGALRVAGLELTTGTGAALLPHADGNRRKIAWRDNTLRATFADKRLSAQGQGVLADGSAISASLRLEDLQTAPYSFKQSRIDGEARIEIKDLRPLAALVYPAADPSGRLRGDLKVAGSAVAPQMALSLALSEGEVRIPPLGIGLGELAMKMDGTYPTYRLSLAGASGGRLRGEGELSLADRQSPELRLKIQGEGFTLARLPELDLLISPDVEAGWRGDQVEVRGMIVVPEARFAPRDLAGAVSPSADVVIVGSGEEQPAAGLSLAADLMVTAGDAVRVDAFGLRGRVTGKLRVTDLPGKPVTGDGILNVDEGTFAVYGRELTIRTGRLLYNGNPLDNPGLQVRAESRDREMTTGIQVSGFLAEPEISFYSDPPMEENEIISRLLMNTALLGSGENDRTFLGSMTGGTGLEPLTSTVRGVTEILRLDEVKITSGRTKEDLSLVIGTWLAPDLYVSYGKNLLKESGSFNTRYLLGYGFSVQTETGATQSGIDLKFEIDRY